MGKSILWRYKSGSLGWIDTRMDQEIQVYFMINPDLFGNGKGLHYEKKNDLKFFLCLFFGVCGFFLLCFCILVFRYFIKQESTFFNIISNS